MKTIFHKTALVLSILSQTACENYEEKYKSQIQETDSLKLQTDSLRIAHISRTDQAKKLVSQAKSLSASLNSILPDTVDRVTAEKLNELHSMILMNASLNDTISYFSNEINSLLMRLSNLSADLRSGAVEETRIREYSDSEKAQLQNISTSLAVIDTLIAKELSTLAWAEEQIKNSQK